MYTAPLCKGYKHTNGSNQCTLLGHQIAAPGAAAASAANAAKDAEIARLKNEIDTLKASVSPKAATAPELAAAAHTERTQPLPSDTDQGNLSTPLPLCAVSST